jgi:threonine synthase
MLPEHVAAVTVPPPELAAPAVLPTASCVGRVSVKPIPVRESAGLGFVTAIDPAMSAGALGDCATAPAAPQRPALTSSCPMPGIIERYRERLPFAAGDPVVSLDEGSTPLILAERLSERAGAEVWLKIEGANPTGSFKDRGMTCAVSAAVREGSEAVICASTGNTAASAAAYSAKAGLTGVVIVPEGKIATGKLAQALMHGARVVALRGNFDEALKLVRELVSRHPISLVNSVNEFRIEGQKTAAFEIVEDLDREGAGELDALCIPVGNAGNITAYWKGFQEAGHRPRMCGFQAAGAAPLVEGKPVEHPETVASAIRIGNPARWEEAMGAMTSSGGAVRAVTDAQILAAWRFLAATEGVFCEPASAASVAGLLTHGAGDGVRRVVCVLTGHGLKDPQTALEHAGAVVPCDPELGAIERAVLG